MSEREERAILEALAQLENDSLATRRGTGAGEDEPELERQYLELLGLLPYELEPTEPSPQVKARLLDTVRAQAEVIPFGAGEPSEPEPVRSRAFRLLAAAVVVLSIGLAMTAGWLYSSLEERRSVLSELQATLDRQGAAERQLAAVRKEVSLLRDRFGLVTSSGVEVCRLRASDGSPQPEASGRLFVAADRQSWVLTVNNLEPCAAGRAYHIWFRTEAGVVSGGSFRVKPGQPIEISRSDLPAGTEAILVTLEEEAEPAAPAGPMVLYGDEAQMML